MANRPQPLSLEGAGRVVAATLLILLLGALVAVATQGHDRWQFRPADWAALRFTVLQALLSALLSVGLAIPLARALMRRRFPLRGLAIVLLGAPFLLPVLVAVLGLLAVFGRTGLVSQGLTSVGLAPLDIYGMQGVVLAHVFFNLPLATRLILQGWLAIPAEQLRLAHALGFQPSDIQRHIEWPMLRGILPGLFLVVFLICTTSFAVALTMGGGPRSTTLELAIYQAFRFDFDLGRAAILGAVQVGLCGLAVLALRGVPPIATGLEGLGRRPPRLPLTGPAIRTQDILLLVAGLGFLLLPMGMVLLRGLPHLADLPAQIWTSALRSLGVAGLSVCLMLAFALPMATALARRDAGWVALAGALPIAVSPLLLGIGAFIALRPWMDPASVVLPLTALVNAVLSLPFVLRTLAPSLRQIEGQHGRVALHLGLSRWAWLRWIVLPRLARPLGFGMGLTAALSMGDLGVITLFADPDRGTLPLAIYQLMGSYQMDAAAAASAVLLGLTLAVFWAFDQGGRRYAAA